MADSPFWMIWPGNAALSALIWFLIAMPFLYAARKPVHELLRAVGLLAGGPLRMGARWLLSAAREMRERNKAVLLAQGARRPSSRSSASSSASALLVTRDLQGYPALQRKLLEEITRVEEDYKKCGEVPPPPPDWVEAVAAVAKVKSNGNEWWCRDPRGDQPLDQGDPRQGARRVPPRLRDAAQDPGRLHAVLALARQDPGAGRHARWPSLQDRAAADRRADGEDTSRSWRRPTRRSTP